MQVDQTVWSWVRGAGQSAVPPFLKNKIAQNATCLLQVCLLNMQGEIARDSQHFPFGG